MDILVLGSDVRDMLKDAVARELIDEELANLILELVRKKAQERAETPPPPKEKKRKSNKKPPPPEDENLPKQLTMFD